MTDASRRLLNDVLEQIDGESNATRDLAELLTNIRENFYDDFESTHPTPMMKLEEDLLLHGFKDLAENVTEGKYDA